MKNDIKRVLKPKKTLRFSVTSALSGLKKFLTILIVFILLIFFNCYTDSSAPSNQITPGELSRSLTSAEMKLLDSGEVFGFKLLKKMVEQQPDSNIFISPLSILMALGMTYNGAETTTLDAMHQTLEYGDLTRQEVNESGKGLITLLSEIDPRVDFDLANSIWYRNDYPVLQEFIDVNENYYDAVVDDLDFSNDTAADTMNMWVSENTNGLIEEIIEAPIDPMTVMFLINTIYFKGTWTYEFDPENTYETNFLSVNNNQTSCQMMCLEGDLPYFKNELFQAVDLQYGNLAFSMTVLLPKSEYSVDDIIDQLNQENWNIWRNSFSTEEMELCLLDVSVGP